MKGAQLSEQITPSDARMIELGELAQRNFEEMAFPASEWEANTLTQLLALPRAVVTRPPVDELIALDMEPYRCHLNCATQQANDPTGESRHVTGWLVYGSDLILHSVVQIGNQWFCMTPQILPASRQFAFIPDPSIDWREDGDGGGKTAYRGGVALPSSLRKYPEDHVRALARFRQLTESGMSAFEAREFMAATVAQPC